MANRVMRIALYWIPSLGFQKVLRDTWEGKYNHYIACKLIAKYSGDCPVWGVHATLLDAVSILEKDRPAFVSKVTDVFKNFAPYDLGKPLFWYKWKPNIIIRWEKEDSMERLKEFRKEIWKVALEFMVSYPVSWEEISNLKHYIASASKPVRNDFLKGLDNFCKDYMKNPLNIIMAPNIPLSWYIDRLSKGKALQDETLPFDFSFHLSVATAVREDEIEIDGTLKTYSAEEVQNLIANNLPNVPEWNKVLEEQHIVDCGFIVEPDPDKDPLEVVVLDRIFGGTRTERRQPWFPKERLNMG